MKLGYQDAGSWTLLKSTPVDRAKAAWLYAQFVVSKTVDVKKSHVGLTFIRESDDLGQELHRARPEARRADRVLPLAGPRAVVADRQQRPGLSEAGPALVAGIGDASSGAKTAQAAMDSLCAEQDSVLERLERAGVQGDMRAEAQRGARRSTGSPRPRRPARRAAA
jgi:glycerol transport system substrate-binding protein